MNKLKWLLGFTILTFCLVQIAQGLISSNVMESNANERDVTALLDSF